MREPLVIDVGAILLLTPQLELRALTFLERIIGGSKSARLAGSDAKQHVRLRKVEGFRAQTLACPPSSDRYYSKLKLEL
jgi:hypothetical protein